MLFESKVVQSARALLCRFPEMQCFEEIESAAKTELSNDKAAASVMRRVIGGLPSLSELITL